MTYRFSDSWMIPAERGQAVGQGWTAETGFRPCAVTWHWTATWDLEACRRLIGGPAAVRKGRASAHYGVGRSFAEGIDRYVSLENRAWHAGPYQTLRWDGQPLASQDYRGSRSTVGIETVDIGYARKLVAPDSDWIQAVSPDGKKRLLIQPWTDEQVIMMIAVGKEIVARWPHIGVREHHGHHDICPGYKVDVSGFPFARVLRGIYDDPEIPDVWSGFWTVPQRKRFLGALNYYNPEDDGSGDQWGAESDLALRRFQKARGMVENGCWTTFTCWGAHDEAQKSGLRIED